jgi:hypothetical protein
MLVCATGTPVPLQKEEKSMSERSQLESILISTRRREWLDGEVIRLSTIGFTRRQIATVCETPSTLAASALARNLEREGIHTVNMLYNLGLGGLLDIEGVGEAQAWIAVCLLDVAGKDVGAWIDRYMTTKGAIREAAHKKKAKAQRARKAARLRTGRTTAASHLRLASAR